VLGARSITQPSLILSLNDQHFRPVYLSVFQTEEGDRKVKKFIRQTSGLSSSNLMIEED